jgi:HTH-type transcriptional regulator/antitoxin HigA
MTISSREEYEEALALLETLIDGYEANRSLIDQLSLAIERWEDQAPEFAAFNRAVADSEPDR